MRTFIYVVVVLISLSVITKTLCLALGLRPQAGPVSLTFDVLVGVALLAWAIALLSN